MDKSKVTVVHNQERASRGPEYLRLGLAVTLPILAFVALIIISESMPVVSLNNQTSNQTVNTTPFHQIQTQTQPSNSKSATNRVYFDVPTWTQQNGVSQINWSAVTSVDVFVATFNTAGILTYDGGFSSTTQQIITTAHQNGATATIGVGGSSMNDTVISTVLSSGTLSQQLVSNIVNEVQLRGYDGVQVDFEGCFNSAGLSSFIQNLYNQGRAVDSNFYIVMSVADWEQAGHACVTNDFNVPALAPYVKYFDVMFNDSPSGLANWTAEVSGNASKIAAGYDLAPGDTDTYYVPTVANLEADRASNHSIFFYSAAIAPTSLYTTIIQAGYGITQNTISSPPVSCSGTPTISLSPSSATPSAPITAIVSGLSNCAGTTVTIDSYLGCTTGSTITSFTSANTGGDATFTAPGSTGSYGYWACLSGTGTEATLVIAALPVLNVAVPSITSQTILQGNTVTIYDSGATGGTSPYTYHWSEESPGTSSFISAANCVSPGTTTCIFTTNSQTTTGTYNFQLSATDSASNTVTSSVSAITVQAPLAVCSGTPILSVTPNTIAPSAKVTATITGLSNCAGANVTIVSYQGCSTPSALVTSFTSGSNGGSVQFTAPGTSNSSFGYFACVKGVSSSEITVYVNATTTSVGGGGSGGGGGGSSSGGGGGGGGGGGSGGGGGGGTFLPSIIPIGTSCEEVTNFTQRGQVEFKLRSQPFTVVENFITPTSAGITVDGASYTIANGSTVPLSSTSFTTAFNASITNLSYLPIIQLITVQICTSSNSTSVSANVTGTTTVNSTKQPTHGFNTSNTVSSTITTSTTSNSNETATSRNQLSAPNNENGATASSFNNTLTAAIAVIVVVLAIVGYMTFHMHRHRKPKEPIR